MHKIDKENRNISSNSTVVAHFRLYSATHYMGFDEDSNDNFILFLYF